MDVKWDIMVIDYGDVYDDLMDANGVLMGCFIWDLAPGNLYSFLLKIAIEFVWLVVYLPSEKYESQMGLLFPVYGKIKFMFQTTNQPFSSLISHYSMVISIDMLNYQRVMK